MRVHDTSPNEPEFHSAGVLVNHEITADVRLLELEVDATFLPGQCATLRIGDVARHYSIASAPGTGVVSVLYDLLPSGLLTPRLAQTRAGDVVEISRPFGSFVETKGEMVWIATGTGIAPFLSMVRSGTRDGVLLYHGARRRERLFYREELLSALGSAYTGCLSAAPQSGMSEKRLTSEGIRLRRLREWIHEAPVNPRATYYLCGGSRMVVDLREVLVRRGVRFGSIEAEIYF